MSIDVFRRNSWVMAIPIDAKESDVRSQARNVRSALVLFVSLQTVERKQRGVSQLHAPRAKWSLATLPLFSKSIDHRPLK